MTNQQSTIKKGRIMKLQLALDVLTSESAIDLATQTRDYIDIIEIGTPLIKHEGIALVKKMRELFPEKEILVDLKTMDVGEYEADFCFKAGADIVTVLGVSDIDTIHGSIKSAKAHQKKVMVDFINTQNKSELAKEVQALGADYIGIHSGIDQQNKGQTPLDDLRVLAKIADIPLVVAGGINLETIDDIAKESPSVIVIGGAITGAGNPREAARLLSEKIKVY